MGQASSSTADLFLVEQSVICGSIALIVASLDSPHSLVPNKALVDECAPGKHPTTYPLLHTTHHRSGPSPSSSLLLSFSWQVLYCAPLASAVPLSFIDLTFVAIKPPHVWTTAQSTLASFSFKTSVAGRCCRQFDFLRRIALSSSAPSRNLKTLSQIRVLTHSPRI